MVAWTPRFLTRIFVGQSLPRRHICFCHGIKLVIQDCQKGTTLSSRSARTNSRSFLFIYGLQNLLKLNHLGLGLLAVLVGRRLILDLITTNFARVTSLAQRMDNIESDAKSGLEPLEDDD